MEAGIQPARGTRADGGVVAHDARAGAVTPGKRVWRFTTDWVSHKLFVTYADGETRMLSLFSPEAFAVLSETWLRTGWALKYSYNFSWLGRAVIQLPEDMLMVQELIWRVQPDFIVETGVAHGGGTVFYASLCELMGKGHVIGIDIEIRPPNRRGIEQHRLARRITLIERSSTARETLEEVRCRVGEDSTVLVLLDSDHSKGHVRQELELYAPLVRSGSYLIATDGNMDTLADIPGGKPSWVTDNPKAAVHEFLRAHPEFELDPEPTRLGVTYWPDAYLRRR